MPIRPEEKARYPKDWHLSATITEALGPNVADSLAVVSGALGYDPALSPHLWEAWVATVTGGDLTPHKSACDVMLDDGRCRIEVKFSQAFSIAFSSGRRRCFKWLFTKPQMRRVGMVDAVVLIGVDAGHVGVWCAPPSCLGRSVTITTPADRLSESHPQSMDRWAVPTLDLLPALLRVCRYDAPHHAAICRQLGWM